MRRLRCAALSQVWCRRERPETEKAPWLERLRHALWSPAIAYGLIMLLCVPMLSYYWAQGPAASVERLAEQAPQALPSADAVIDDSRGNLGRESAALGSSGSSGISSVLSILAFLLTFLTWELPRLFLRLLLFFLYIEC